MKRVFVGTTASRSVSKPINYCFYYLLFTSCTEISDSAATYSFLPEAIGDHVTFEIIIILGVYLYMNSTNETRNVLWIP